MTNINDNIWWKKKFLVFGLRRVLCTWTPLHFTLFVVQRYPDDTKFNLDSDSRPLRLLRLAAQGKNPRSRRPPLSRAPPCCRGRRPSPRWRRALPLKEGGDPLAALGAAELERRGGGGPHRRDSGGRRRWGGAAPADLGG